MKNCAYLIFFVLSISLATSYSLNNTGGFHDVENDTPRFKFAFKNSTYELTNVEQNWQMSNYYCKWIGMELVSIETEEESLAIQTALDQFNVHFWIGLNDLASEGNYNWAATGKLAGPFFNWDESEPDGFDNLNCVYLIYQRLKWSDTRCSETYRALCESVPCPGKNDQ